MCVVLTSKLFHQFYFGLHLEMFKISIQIVYRPNITKRHLDVVIGMIRQRSGRISDMGDIFKTCIEHDDDRDGLTSL